MVAKIGRGSKMAGALSYNYLKVQEGNAHILATHKMVQSLDGYTSVAQLNRSFELYLVANKQTEKPVLHISLNPDPIDTVSDKDFRDIAKAYMDSMGYGEQPYVVFKHEDIDRAHIHIVTVCVDSYGKKIDDRFEKRRSMDACRALEKKFNLKPAIQKNEGKDVVFRPVDYRGNDIKSQIASVVRHLPKYYKFQTLGAYNALLSLFHITAQQVSGELQGKPRKGLVYFALDENGQKAGNPFKASMFGKHAGLDMLEKHFGQSKEQMKVDAAKAKLKTIVETALKSSANETDFKKQLISQGINTVIRRNGQNHLYGITFIDHGSKSVWNGSQLDRGFSANTFNELWREPQQKEIATITQTKNMQTPDVQQPHVESDENQLLADFLSLGGLFDVGWYGSSAGEDYNELEFEREMKKKKKRKKGYRH